jgi:hypothetical protein
MCCRKQGVISSAMKRARTRQAAKND